VNGNIARLFNSLQDEGLEMHDKPFGWLGLVAMAMTVLASTVTTSAVPAKAAANNATTSYCTLFTTDQMAATLGKPVKAGHVPEMASDACQWDAASGKGVVTVMATLAGIWNDMRAHEGLRPVQGIGQKAYVGISAAGGMQAGAVAACGTKCPAMTVDNAFYLVRIDPAPSDDVVLGLLREFIKRSTR
jgi:hypothetical protein